MAFHGYRILRTIPKLDYFGGHKICFVLSLLFSTASVVALCVRGLNFSAASPTADGGADLIADNILAIVAACAGIMIYMWVRLGRRAGIVGIIALLHDCLATLGLFSLARLPFDMNGIVAIAIVAGFSVIDTIVLEDRIRENRRLHRTMDCRALLNLSISQTIPRTLTTNGLALLAAVTFVIFAKQSLFSLSLALSWGIMVGTYSTIYITAPLEWYLGSHRRSGDREPAQDIVHP